MTDIQNPEVKEVEQKLPANPVQTTQENSEPEIKTEQNKANWAQFRELREKERREKQEAQKLAEQRKAEADALKAAMEAILNKQSVQEDNTYISEDEQQKINRLVNEAIEKRIKQHEELQKQREIQELPKRLNETYRDFDKVCSTENLDYLEYHFPEVAKGFRYMPEGVEKWSSIYQAVKKFVPFENKKQDEARIERNLQKPQANVPSMHDTSPKTTGWKLTEEQKAANWARMRKEMKSF